MQSKERERKREREGKCRARVSHENLKIDDLEIFIYGGKFDVFQAVWISIARKILVSIITCFCCMLMKRGGEKCFSQIPLLINFNNNSNENKKKRKEKNSSHI